MSILEAVHASAFSRIAGVTLPRASTALAVPSMTAISLTPGLLPRTAALQGLFTGILISAGILALWALSSVLRLPAHRINTRAWRAYATILGSGSVAVLMAAAGGWQNSLRAAMGAPAIGIPYWIEVGAVATLTATLLIVLPSAARKVMQNLGFSRTTSVVALCVVGLHLAVGNVDSASAQATEAQKFLGSGSDSVRVYAALNSAPDAHSRAEYAVSELVRSGGFDRAAVVVAIPTGSGWIDTHAVDGLEQRFGGDVAIIGQQYSTLPSWAAFLFQRNNAEESARALFTAIGVHISTMPAADRPDLFLYGQSLGAVGGSAALTQQNPIEPCGVLWAGPPAGATRSDGATVLANTSDPVVWWSPALAVHRPDLSRTVQDAPIPQWFPVLSFLQTSVDMLAALDVPAGHGHRYGTQQGTKLGQCR